MTVAVLPSTAKSAASTFATASENVTRHVRLSALVGESAGVRRTMDRTVGAVASAGGLATMSNSSLAVSPSPSSAVTFTVSVPAVVGVPVKVRFVALNVSQDGRALSSSRVAL